jgi:Domain of unknown function (DUF2019)
MAIESVDDLLATYREGAEGTSAPNPKIANKWQRKMHGCYKRLRETPEGRAGITVLMKDSSPQVRCWAAAHSLQWEPIEAQRTLQALRESGGPCSFDAEMTLQQFSNGALSFEY